MGTGQEILRDSSGFYPSGAEGWVREWDGHAWAESVVSDPGAPVFPTWHQRPWAVLVHPRFLLWFGCWLVALALAVVFLRIGFTFFAVLGGVIGVVGVLGALLWMVFRRLHLQEAISMRALLGWGLVSGVVATLVAVLIESGMTLVIHSETPIQGLGIAGPVEETAKILVPVILYLVGRYRDPRAGIALALVSGALFGLGEEIIYLVRDAHLSALIGGADVKIADVSNIVFRPFVEPIHVLFAGFIAAVAWRAGWVRGAFWPALIGAWLLAAVLHSGFDVLDGISQKLHGVEVISPVIILVTYFFVFRGSARQLPPPAALRVNPPAWRPTLPKKRSAAAAPDELAATAPVEHVSH